MTVFNALFRAPILDDPDSPIPWPDVPVALEGAVPVGRIGASPNFWWHAVTQDADAFAQLEAIPGYRAATYAGLLTHNGADANDIFLAVYEEDDPGNPGQKRRRRVKMKNKPGSGIIVENLPPHKFAGIDV